METAKAIGQKKTKMSFAKRTVVAESAVPDFEPVRMLEVEIGQPLPAISAADPESGAIYRKGLALVRLHTQPLGLIDVRLDTDGLSAEEYACQIWQALGPEIVAHLQQDGFPVITGLDASGIPIAATPPCLAARARFLADAPFVSVIIPTREHPDRLATCLCSILASEYPRSRYEIIVADNAPRTSATADLVNQTDGGETQVRYIREDTPGSASARNRGLTIASGEIVAFTDDDVVVDTHWLTELARGFADAEHVACVTGLVVPMELETPAQVWFEQYGGFTREGYARRVFNLTNHRLKTPLYPYTAGVFGTGNSMAFRRSTLQKIGAFDPMLGNGTPALGGVDSEVLLRTILKGQTIVCEPAAIVHHAHRREYTDLRKQIYNYGAGLTAYYVKTLLMNPQLVPDFIARLPRGLLFAFSPHSEINQKKEHDYPKELTWIERRGMIYGPLAYFRSRRWWSRLNHAAAVGEKR